MKPVVAGSAANQTPDRVPFNYFCGKTLQQALDGPHSFVYSRDASCSTSLWVLKTAVPHLDDTTLFWLDSWALQMRSAQQLNRLLIVRTEWSKK